MLTGFVIRSGLVIGAVYYSSTLGVWGNMEETEHLYENIKTELRPYARQLEQQLPFEVPALPRTGEVSFLTKHYYNQGVKATFHFVHMLPCYTGQLVKKARDAFDEFAKSPAPTATSAVLAKK